MRLRGVNGLSRRVFAVQVSIPFMVHRVLLVTGIVIATLLAGCTADDANNANPASSLDSPPDGTGPSMAAPKAFNLSAEGEVGQHVWACLLGACVPGPETRPPENVHQLSLEPGVFEGGEVTLTWSPETPLSDTLQIYVLLRDAPCEEACWNEVAQASGSSPLQLDLPKDSLGDPFIVENQSVAFVVASTTNVEDRPVEVLFKSGQPFRLDSVLWLSPRAAP